MEKYGRLTVLEKYYKEYPPYGNRMMFLCQCDCGNIVNIWANSVKTGNTISCGCYEREQTFLRCKKYNEYDLTGKYGIGIDSNNEEFYFDLDDYEKIKSICWYVRFRNGKVKEVCSAEIGTRKHILLHQFVLGISAGDGIEIDHADKNPRNNQKYNLRDCTHAENLRNKSVRSDNVTGITGIGWDKSRNKWIGRLTINGKRIFRKRYDNLEDAIYNRLKAEKQYFGEFAPQRHLFSQYGIE
jgi:hypothetical protein